MKSVRPQTICELLEPSHTPQDLIEFGVGDASSVHVPHGSSHPYFDGRRSALRGCVRVGLAEPSLCDNY